MAQCWSLRAYSRLSWKVCKRAKLRVTAAGAGLGTGPGFTVTPCNNRLLHNTARTCGVQKILMPALSPTMVDGTIVKWHKTEGDSFTAGDIICDIQTDKAIVSIEMEEDGIIAKIMKPDNTKNVQIGELIALSVDEGEDWQNVPIPDAATAANAPSQGAAPVAPSTASDVLSAAGNSQPFGPAVRSILDTYDIRLGDVTPTGPKARLLKGDLLRYIKENHLQARAPLATPAAVAPPSVPTAATLSPPPPRSKTPAKRPPPPPPAVTPLAGEFVDIALSDAQILAARQITESKMTVPQVYATIDCTVDQLVTLLSQVNESAGSSIDIVDFVVKTVAHALKQLPTVNVVWSDDAPRLLGSVDVGVALATDDGLVTGIVRDAASLSLQAISDSIKALLIQVNGLQPTAAESASIVIARSDPLGAAESLGMLRAPHACMLTVGGTRRTLDASARPCTRITVTLTADGRAVDDQLACELLATVKTILETPVLLLSGGGPTTDSLQAGSME